MSRHRKPGRMSQRFMTVGGWVIAIALVVFAVPPGVVVIVSHGLWRKLAIGGHVRAIAVFLRQARTYHRSDLT